MWLKQIRPDALDMYVLYGENKVRYTTYMQMTEAQLYWVRQGLKVVVVFYGHPGIFVLSTHRAIKIARREGHKAMMKASVSALDTLALAAFTATSMLPAWADQINRFLPFTDVYDSNSLWCESAYGLKDYRPINLKFGQALLWDGGFLEHGTFKNETGQTRVSCDFRFSMQHLDRVREPWSNILLGRTLDGKMSAPSDPSAPS